MTPEQQLAEDVAWMEGEATAEEALAERFAVAYPEDYEAQRTVEAYRACSARFRRILATLSAREEPDEYVMELENIVCDALHTLENEMTAGTRFDEPEWVRGTLAALRSIKSTMDDRDPSPPSDATPG